MIKLESAHIEELRGIKKLDIDFSQKTFAVHGPNGSGKSGVIDAIEFGLTGQIGRLMGRGTKGLTLADHGPHVDMTRFPDASFVSLKVFIPDLGKSATITRKISTARKPKIEPDDADVKAAFDEIAAHPEITLSRREILRFILAEPSKRSEEIQTLLRLESIGDTRAALATTQNRLQRDTRAAEAKVRSSRDILQRHLQVAAFQASAVLGAINIKRQTLGLSAIEMLSAETKLDDGLAEAGKAPPFNKQSALRDLEALATVVSTIQQFGISTADSILTILRTLELDPALLFAVQRRALLEKGLELIDGAACPLCDSDFDDEDHLREHLEAKLLKSRDAEKLQAALLDSGAELARHATQLGGLIAKVNAVAASQSDVATQQLLGGWFADLDKLKVELTSQDGLIGLKERLLRGWARLPPAVSPALSALTTQIETLADQSAIIDAQTFVATAQLRLDDYRGAMREHKSAETATRAAKAAYDVYCRVMASELEKLYDAVQNDFSEYYKQINDNDETMFTAKFTPSAGALDLSVNFYERGLFPPGAFHSEGHQDGMGVCLYLALMKHLFQDRFTIALLDDVVMSVDSDHRYKFCKLLKSQFPHTQFIITTHDRLWAQQMRSATLVTAKTSLAFHGWHVDTGPIVASQQEIWEDIAAALGKGNMVAAAAGLRNHLEYTSWHLADQLGAQPVFRADGGYELGDLLPSILKRMGELCGKAAAAAQSWGDTTASGAATARRTALATSNGAASVEQWAVNKALHYNQWANFGRRDFEPVVAAFKELLDCFKCSSCGSWIYVSPRGRPETVRCQCGGINVNLTQKSRDA